MTLINAPQTILRGTARERSANRRKKAAEHRFISRRDSLRCRYGRGWGGGLSQAGERAQKSHTEENADAAPNGPRVISVG